MNGAVLLRPAPTRSLRAVVTEILDDTELSDPRDIATEVLTRLTDAERDEILRAALVTEVRVTLHEHRKAPIGDRPAATPRPSAKVRAIRDAWAQLLNGRYSVGGEWKRLAEFTPEDARAVAAERRRMAAESAAWADRFDALAAAITAAGVTTAGELPAAPAEWLS
jgi:hypothetical protein